MQEIWEMNTLERRYSVPPSTISDPTGRGNPVEDLHAWSIYRQNINSGFTDSALGSSEKSSPPYGNFKLRESTVHSILSHPKYGPSSRRSHTDLGGTGGGAGSMYSYLKFGLPRVFPPALMYRTGAVGGREGSSGYDSSDDGTGRHQGHHGMSSSAIQRANRFRRSRSDPDFRSHVHRGAGGIGDHRTSEGHLYHHNQHANTYQHHPHHHHSHQQHGGVAAKLRHDTGSEFSGHSYWRDRRQKSSSEMNLLSASSQLGATSGGVGGERKRYKVHTKNASSSTTMHRPGSVTATTSMNGPRHSGHHELNEVQSTSHQHYHRHHHQERSSAGHRAKRSQAGSKSGSQMSVLSHTTRSSRTHIGAFNALAQAGGIYSREAQLLNEKFFPKDSFITTFLGDVEGGVFKHPHLQVRNLSYEVSLPTGCSGKPTSPFGEDKYLLLDSITMEVHGGEIMAIMATSEEEGTTLLDVLANRSRQNHAHLRGDLMVNGVPAQPDKLENRVSYVQQDCIFTPDMSVRQTLLFTSLLKEPGNPSRGFDTKGRINALIEDLGLGIVKHTRVKHLTLSEKRRLNVACHLLLDTDIVLLDQPTKGMDIFDTFFLVEYLRQWAARGRIVILTILPPTYEIFTMMSKIALLSSGRLMYFGKRREMLPYFAFIEFPCPAYKNPSDYYLDLVTLDNLSAEAMLESSERIKLLADSFHRRQEPLSDPGPPGIPPPKVKSANILVQILALWIRALIYMFPYNLITLGKNIFIVALMSILIGTIYEGVRLSTYQDAVQDRFGFHYVMMGVAVWPLIFLTVSEVWYNKDAISRDLEDKMYTKAAYIISKITYSFLTAGGVFLAYIIPAYCMSGLKGEEDNVTFSVYMGYMLLYLFSVRTLAMAMAYTFDSRHVAAACTGFVFTLVVMSSGYAVHFLDLSVLLSWMQWVSPMRWTLEQIVIWDLVGRNPADTDPRNSPREEFTCANVVDQQAAGIILKPPCSFSNGYDAASFYDYYVRWPLYVPILITIAFGLFWFVWIFVFFNGKAQVQKKSRSRLQSLTQ